MHLIPHHLRYGNVWCKTMDYTINIMQEDLLFKIKRFRNKKFGIFYKQVPGLSEPSLIKNLCHFME